MFYPHTIKGKPFPRLDLISAPIIPNRPGPTCIIDTTITDIDTSGGRQFQLPLIEGLVYFASVDWGDGTESYITDPLSPEALHNYDTGGQYELTITGIFPSMSFNGEGDGIKMIEWLAWGNVDLSEGMFWGCSNLTFSSISSFSPIGSSLENAFRDCSSMTDLIALDFLGLNGAIPVTSLKGMFWGCTLFNKDITMWDTIAVTNMASMFRGCPAFNQDVGVWDVDNVTNAEFMFLGATIFNQNIGGWTTSNFVDIAAMFLSAPAFNQDIGGWDVSNVISCGGLFFGASSFNQNINAWDTSSFGTLEFVFQDAVSFNQPLSNWDTSNVLEMQYVFAGATSFNQDISNFNVGQVETMDNMLTQSGISNANYGAFLISCANQPLHLNILLGAFPAKYPASSFPSRLILTTQAGWVITDGGPE